MKRLTVAALVVGGVGLVAATIAAVAISRPDYTGEIPAPMALEKGDFMIFSGSYAAQVRDGFRPRADARPLQLAPPIDWNMDPFEDRNWRFQLHSWRMLNPVWSQWYGRDPQRLVAEIMPWVSDWHAYHVDDGRQSDFEWYDMAAGYRAQHLAMLLHLERQGRISMTPRQSRTLRDLARLHVRKLRDPQYITHGNHAIVQLHGLRMLCQAWRDEMCRGEEAYSSHLMRRLLASQFGEQGVHTENSPGYHLFALKKFSGLRPALYPSIAGEFAAVLAQARAVAPWFTLPDGRVAAIGDSSGPGARFDRHMAPPCSSTTAAGTCIIHKDLSAGGYAVVRSAPGTPRGRASMLIVTGASVPPGSHDHADELGFELVEGGRSLLVDSGKYTYNKDPWRRYFLSDRAHNVVGLEGRVYGPSDTLTRGSALEALAVDEGVHVITGKVERTGGFGHRRELRYRPEDSLVVSDRLDLPAGASAVAYWHLAPGLDAAVSDGSVVIADGDVPLATLELEQGKCLPTVVEGRAGPGIQGWVSPSYMKRVPAAVVEYHCSPGVTRIRTRIRFARNGGGG